MLFRPKYGPENETSLTAILERCFDGLMCWKNVRVAVLRIIQPHSLTMLSVLTGDSLLEAQQHSSNMGDIDRRENQCDDLIQGKTYVAVLTINDRRDGARLQHFKRIDRSFHSSGYLL
jgi:hypothetical protein